MTGRSNQSIPHLIRLMNFAGAGRRRVRAYQPPPGVNFRAYTTPSTATNFTMGGPSAAWNDASPNFTIPDGVLTDAAFGGTGATGRNVITGSGATVKTGYSIDTDVRIPSGGGSIEIVAGLTNFSSVEDVQVLVDDQPVDPVLWMNWGIPDANGVTKMTMTWEPQTSAPMPMLTCNVRVLMGSAVFATIRSTAGMIFRAATKRRKAIVIGDSTWAGNQPGGVDGNVMAGTLHGRVSALTGYGIYNLSQPGTGVRNVLASASNGESTYGSASRRAGWQAITDALDLIIVQCTANDLQWYVAQGATAAALQSIQQGYTDLYALLATDKPGVPVVAAGLQSASKQGNSTQETDVNNAMRAATRAAPNVIRYIDEVREQWVTGTGNGTTPSGSGNRDLYVGADDLHPTKDFGNDFRSRKFLMGMEIAR